MNSNQVVLINAHGDTLHRSVVTEAIHTYNNAHELKAKWLTFSCDLEQEGFKGDEEYLLILPDHILQHLGSMEGELSDPFDVHAGAFETANMNACYKELTNTTQAEKEKATMLQGEQIHKWQQGHKEDRFLIPEGYVGSPADYHKIQSTPEQYNREIVKEIIKYYQKEK